MIVERNPVPFVEHLIVIGDASYCQTLASEMASLSQAFGKPVSLPYACQKLAIGMRNRVEIRQKGMPPRQLESVGVRELFFTHFVLMNGIVF